MLSTSAHRSTDDCSATMKANKDMDSVLDPEVGDGQSEDTEEEKVYKVSLNVIPIFIVEVLSIACLCVLAYYLRFETKFPVVVRGFRCNDPTISLPRFPKFGNNSAPLNVRHQVLYGVSIGVPVALIILGELGRCLFSTTNKKVVRAGCVSCKLHLVTRRIVRIAGGFIFGLFCTSIITDSLKLATGCLRPYFLEACKVRSNYCDSVSTSPSFSAAYQYASPEACITPEHELRDARTSFPSLHASLSAYSGLFIMIYINQVLIIKASRLLRPWIVIAIGCLVLLCGASRVVLHQSHWHDVVAGYIIGIVVALYMSSSVLKFFLEYYQWNRRQCCNRNNGRHSSPRPLFFRYFHIPRVSYQNKSGQSYPSNGQDGYGYSPRNRAAVNEAFRKDLHQRVEDYGRRRGFQSES